MYYKTKMSVALEVALRTTKQTLDDVLSNLRSSRPRSVLGASIF